MIARDQVLAIGQRRFGAVTERNLLRFVAERAKNRFVGDASQSEDHARRCLPPQLAPKKYSAGRDFEAVRFVLRRYATHRIGDPAALELKPVIGSLGKSAARKPMPQQSGIENNAGIVARKRSPRPVGAFEPGRQADDEERRVFRTE